MSNNVVSLPFEDLAEIDRADAQSEIKRKTQIFMGEVINPWFDNQGIDIETNAYRHQAAVILTQLQVILMGAK